MLFHIFIILALLALAGALFADGQEQYNRKIYLWIAFGVLFFISAFRSTNIGNDTPFYAFLFEYYGSAVRALNLEKFVYLFNFDNVLNSRIEPGFIFLNILLNFISNDYLILFVVVSAFVVGVWMIHIYQNSSMVWLSVALFINLRFFYFSLSNLRQSIAMAIILISYKFLKERKLLPFLLCVCIAALFHLSALVFIIAYPLTAKVFNYKALIYGAIIAGLGYIGFDYFINLFLRFFPRYSMYLESVYFDGYVRIASIINVLVALALLLLGVISSKGVYKPDNPRDIDKNEKQEINLLNYIMLISLVLSFISIKASILGRLHMYFFIFSIIYTPRTLIYIKNVRLRVVIVYILLLAIIAYNFTILYFRPEWLIVYPWEFIWSTR